MILLLLLLTLDIFFYKNRVHGFQQQTASVMGAIPRSGDEYNIIYYLTHTHVRLAFFRIRFKRFRVSILFFFSSPRGIYREQYNNYDDIITFTVKFTNRGVAGSVCRTRVSER